MSQKLLLQKRKEVRDLHLNNPNFTSKPPIGEDSQTFYTPRQCGDRDKQWKPSSKPVEIQKAVEYQFKTSSKPVKEYWERNSQGNILSPQQMPVKVRPEFEASKAYKRHNDRKVFLGTGQRDNKNWHSSVFLPTYNKLMTSHKSGQPTQQLKDIMSYKYAKPYRDDMDERVRFQDYTRKGRS